MSADDLPPQVLAPVRAACMALPEAYEEPAWVGTRWRVRTKTFAHVLRIEAGWPPAYAKVAGSDGPLTVVTFRAPLPEVERRRATGRPFFLPGWWPDIVGVEVDDRTDWGEIAELVTESYRVLAPKKLVALLDAAPP